MTLSSALALFGAMFVLSITPGPSDFAVVARSISAGLRHAAYLVCGIIVADVIFILLALYGMAAIAENFAGLFTGIKLACAAYLAWMGIQLWLQALPDTDTMPTTDAAATSSFAAGFLITLADPKAIFFYMGFLPAFVDLSSITWIDVGIIIGLATIVVAVVKLGYALLATRAVALFNSPVIRRRLNRASATVLIATAGFLAFYV